MATAEILLIMCPMWDISIPPLGIAYLASYLEHHGFPVDILDINIEAYHNSPQPVRSLWKFENYNLWAKEDLFATTAKHFEKDIEFYLQEILKKDYKVIGFSLYGANILFSVELARRLKKQRPGLRIIFGGPSCSFLHDNLQMPIRLMVSTITGEPLFAHGLIDAFVVGEGEEVLLGLIRYFLKAGPAPLSGVVLSLANGYSEYAPHPLIKDLDGLSYPAWEKFPLHLYPSNDTLPLLLSRGCINRCAFCNDWKIWKAHYRCRSADNIFKEIKKIVETWQIRVFRCSDLMFNGDLYMLEELAEYLIESGLGIIWAVQGTVRKDMDARFLRVLKKSGLKVITYGIESLSENVLYKMHKRYSFRDIQDVLKNTKKAGIDVFVNFIVGAPYETDEDFNLTKNRLRKIRKYIDMISSLNPCYVTAETELEKDPQKYAILLSQKDWWCNWESIDGTNTFEIRKARAKELYRFAKALKIKINFLGLYEEEKPPAEITCRRKRGAAAFLIAVFVAFLALSYVTYFWIYKKFTGKAIFD
jgi:anaerobic magnesium-protoporphyrin IX monomethyl ester cyclase